MMHNLVPISIVLGLAYFIYKIIELNVRRKERIMLIERISELSNCKLDLKNIKLESSNKFTTLRWALLTIGVGLGLFFAMLIDIDISKDVRNYEIVSAIYGSLICLFGGIGLLISYFIEYKSNFKDKE